MKTVYVLHMWTGLLENERGLPRVFSSIKRAARALKRYPSWGQSAVTVRRCRVRPGVARPDYIIGAVVS